MKTALQDFKMETCDVERVLKLESDSLETRHRVPYTIAANGRRYVWAADAVKAVRPRFPERSFAQLKLSQMAGENG